MSMFARSPECGTEPGWKEGVQASLPSSLELFRSLRVLNLNLPSAARSFEGLERWGRRVFGGGSFNRENLTDDTLIAS